MILLLADLAISPDLPGWRKFNSIIMTRRPHYPCIAANLYCLPISFSEPCEVDSFTCHVKVSSARLHKVNEDIYKVPWPRALLHRLGVSNRGTPEWKTGVIDSSSMKPYRN